MSAIDEAALAKGILAAPIAEGVRVLSQNQVITFTKYLKFVLPIDGSVYWLKADQFSKAAILNTFLGNEVQFDQIPIKLASAPTIEVQGSLHYSTTGEQNEDENVDKNHVVFSALSQVQIFNEINPNEMYVGEFQGLKFAWNSRGRFYKQADLYHYVGDAIYPAMQTQLVEDVSTFQPELVVSNSLPIWLSMNLFNTTGWQPIALPAKLYPSYLTPPNLRPPYMSVQIDSTEAIAASPSLSSTMSHDQLCVDRVRITSYGLVNRTAMDMIDFVEQFSLSGNVLGLMNMPVFRDDKRTQVEFDVLAMKKTVEYRVSYLQSQARGLSRQLIKQAKLQIYFDGHTNPGIGMFVIGVSAVG